MIDFICGDCGEPNDYDCEAYYNKSNERICERCYEKWLHGLTSAELLAEGYGEDDWLVRDARVREQA